MKNELDENYSDCYYWYNTNSGIMTSQMTLIEEISNLTPINSLLKSYRKEISITKLKDKIDKDIHGLINSDIIKHSINTKLICQPIHPLDNNIGLIVNIERNTVINDKLSNWKIRPYGKIIYLNSYLINSGGLENDFPVKKRICIQA